LTRSSGSFKGCSFPVSFRRPWPGKPLLFLCLVSP